MTCRIAIVVLLLGLCVAGNAGADAPRGDDAAARILVTIHIDATDTMHGDPVERYHRPHDYSAGALADGVLDALAAEYGLVRVRGWPMRALAVHCEVFALAPGADAELLATRLAHDARVDSAEPLRRFQTLTAAGNSYRSLQHTLDELDVDDAHAVSRGAGVRIAVIDSGIDATHPNLAHAVRARREFTDAPPAAHGTEVAGVIAARDNHGAGIVGVAPEAELLDLRACWSERNAGTAASCDSYSLAQALDYAVSNGVDIINLSLAGPADPLLARLLAAAESRGICVVVAEPPAHDALHAFPSSSRSVIVVGMSEDARRPGSAQVRAPGADVFTTFPGGRYDYASGSSLAAAHVTGLVALTRALRPQIEPQLMRTLLASRQHLSATTILSEATALR